ncbi:MAG: bifunctional demethylmenaquinone methyltransferase/2-methoxy-6-polyprenyl-1,4-benzoquinol methylase UbiE [Rhodobiaceae bacterium]|nr:bifunctional demethylmenaquinone methyltransferase/2-methoxy-6-polyprenyl-1,4-benzoquinol methylase UbiE [Rhodobiaceae bacterium]MDC3085034.1 bifunctional demethylmenaquinone methyltransferase/2-methoxy-6-polyprenyl-1,4-benzoquinol methylase UbiE [Gammaproteobacteria bacterium]|tara:strand:+ start:10675 stop:11436 length:762 start_codon:yes stop_codon:yes gene_type:complete
MANNKKYFFGDIEVSKVDKVKKVNEVFSSVADRYDIMNDLLSLGTHRLWKEILVNSISNLISSKRAFNYLDLACGTGDIGYKLLDKKSINTNVYMMDINETMIEQAIKRKEYKNFKKNIDFIVSDAENIPLASNSMDCVAIAFGIRNVASMENALFEINRVLKSGGKFLCLEFSSVEVPIIKKFYDFYSKNIIPEIGNFVTKDRNSYQYLVESIERFPKQDELTDLITKSRFINTKYTNLSGGIACIHSGWKI